MRKARSRRSLQVGAALLLAVLVTAGCGDDTEPTTTANPSDTNAADGGPSTSSAPSVSPTTSPSSAAVGTGACKYVTTAQASALAMSPVKAGTNHSVPNGPVTFDYCDYIFDPGNSPGVSVAIADLAGNGPALFAAYKQSEANESDFQDVAGVGDEAFFAGTNLNVRKGNTGLIVFVGRSTGYPRGADAIADEKQLAALVVGQL
ncbi:MAG: hypothetical protein QOE93_2124 [Actinomycetota bacterium]|jgi:hypothetical protein|nr:hypothetical protein [Actinomycetota bacterium]